MDRLDPIFRAIPRHAETTDTRQDIKRHDNDDPRRKKREKEEGPEEEDPWQDSTTVSVQALSAFLQNLILQQDKKAADGGSPAPPASKAPPAQAQPAAPSDARARQAVGAYQRTVQATQPPTISHENQQDTEKTLPDTPRLTTEEIRTMHRLIADLEILATAGVESLVIRRAESFLQGLVNAAAEARLKLS